MRVFKIGLVGISLFSAINNGSIADDDKDNLEDQAARSVQYNAREDVDLNNAGENGIVVAGWQAPLAPQLPGFHQPELALSPLLFELAALYDESPGSVRIVYDDRVVFGKGLSPYSSHFFE